METDSLCRRCGRLDNGSKKCRDHPKPKEGDRVYLEASDAPGEGL